MGKTRGRRDRDTSCDETKLYLQEPCLEKRIPEVELMSITEVPEGLDTKEWLALHTIGFFEHINLMYGTISEFCTLSICPEMVGPGPRYYLWIDDKSKKSRVSSPQYVDFVMTFVQKTVNDETLFPTKEGKEFPPNFDVIIKKIHRLLFHVLAYIHHSHFREVVLLGLHAHLNSLFAHLIEFNLHYQTIEDKEIEVLQDLIKSLKIMPSVNNNLGGEEEEEDEEEGGDQLDNAVKDKEDENKTDNVVMDTGEDKEEETEEEKVEKEDEKVEKEEEKGENVEEEEKRDGEVSEKGENCNEEQKEMDTEEKDTDEKDTKEKDTEEKDTEEKDSEKKDSDKKDSEEKDTEKKDTEEKEDTQTDKEKNDEEEVEDKEGSENSKKEDDDDDDDDVLPGPTA
ncbi:MOB kinase activator-like 2 [Eurytemora carolleeae]|uniref:MOB kinase activator-like 2 n=1 Tax=Eurytemora carolleeae TaxID=1294199 RepID=UPI000C790E27|nr:MOB kinase activator-like 2 [Eurytemora carolleeae]|eukprot:XP_023346111.1 MOB kinase activator-like 2 [Eurytemora affinis]